MRLDFVLIFCMTVFANVQATSLMGQMSLDENDRIIFLGDSITAAGDRRETGYVQLVRNSLTKSIPGIEVIGAGISGHKVPNLIARLQKDVIDKKPTAVVVYIGINDVWHSENGKGTSKDDFKNGLMEIVNDIRKADSKVLLCTASVIGEKTNGSNPLDAMLEEYCEISRSVAAEMNVPVIDLRREFMEYLKKNNPENNRKNILTSDGVHLNQRGDRFVAGLMESALRGGSATDDSGKLLRHVVLFKFKDGLPEAEIATIVEAFGKLKSQISEIVDYEFGTDISTENLSQGFTHCFVVTFENEAGRDKYLPHQAHQDFVKLLKDKIDEVLIVGV